MDTPAAGVPKKRTAGRRSAIGNWLVSRNATTQQITEEFFVCGGAPETARKRANRWLCKQRKKKFVKIRGYVQLKDSGRPEIVYGCECSEALLEHSVSVTGAEQYLGRFIRNAKIGKTTADGLHIRDGVKFWVEVDNETMTARQMRKKWIAYGEVDGFILVICRTKSRMRRLIKTAKTIEAVRTVTLFSRFRLLRSTKISEPWVDCSGKRVALP